MKLQIYLKYFAVYEKNLFTVDTTYYNFCFENFDKIVYFVGFCVDVRDACGKKPRPNSNRYNLVFLICRWMKWICKGPRANEQVCAWSPTYPMSRIAQKRLILIHLKTLTCCSNLVFCYRTTLPRRYVHAGPAKRSCK